MNQRVSPIVAVGGMAIALLVVAAAIVGFLALGRPGGPPPSGSVPPSSSPGATGSEGPGPSGSGGAVASGSPTASPAPAGSPRERALAEREVFGFLPYWQINDPQTQVPLDTLTTLAIFGVEAGRDGRLVRETSSGGTPPGWAVWDSSATSQLINQAHAEDVRVVLTVQRFAWNSGQARRTIALLSDPAKRASLIRDIVGELAAKHADGVNLDFEPVPSEVASEFVDFVRELRAALDSAHPGLQLTFDTTTDVGAWDLAALTADDAADAAFLMAYDFRTGSARIAGSVDPLVSTSSNNIVGALDEMLSVIAPDRVILGLPWYGRAWSTLTADAGSGTLAGNQYVGPATVEFADAVEQALRYGRNYDETEASAWTVYRREACSNCPSAWRQLWYDDVDGMILKQSLVPERGLRGLGIWALGDDKELPDAWSAMRVSLGGLVDTTAPTGQAEVDPASFTRRRGELPIVAADLHLSLTSADGAGGSGLAFVRVATEATLGTDGSLATGITYPQAEALTVPLDDERLVPPPQKGEGRVFVQWRDVSGNWSAPAEVAFWLSSTEPSPRGSGSPAPVETEIPTAEPDASEGEDG